MIVRDRPPSSKGFTLPELLVAGTIFGMILFALVSIENTSRRLTKKTDAHDDVYRAAVVTSAYLQQELKNAVVLATFQAGDPTVKLIYKLPELDATGNPLTNKRGNITFQPGDYSLILASDGQLSRRSASGDRPIAKLGNLATVSFTLEGTSPNTAALNKNVESEFLWREDTLRAKILASHESNKGEKPADYRFELTFFLRNQHPH
jgi:prepilin-type N-terminal cleavage/methylation domain-containing protein